MHRVRLLTIGMVMAGFLGVVLSGFWDFTLGIIIAAVVFITFAIAAFLGGGPGWTHDDDDRKSWH